MLTVDSGDLKAVDWLGTLYEAAGERSSSPIISGEEMERLWGENSPADLWDGRVLLILTVTLH